MTPLVVPVRLPWLVLAMTLGVTGGAAGQIVPPTDDVAAAAAAALAARDAALAEWACRTRIDTGGRTTAGTRDYLFAQYAFADHGRRAVLEHWHSNVEGARELDPHRKVLYFDGDALTTVWPGTRLFTRGAVRDERGLPPLEGNAWLALFGAWPRALALPCPALGDNGFRVADLVADGAHRLAGGWPDAAGLDVRALAMVSSQLVVIERVDAPGWFVCSASHDFVPIARSYRAADVRIVLTASRLRRCGALWVPDGVRKVATRGTTGGEVVVDLIVELIEFEAGVPIDTSPPRLPGMLDVSARGEPTKWRQTVAGGDELLDREARRLRAAFLTTDPTVWPGWRRLLAAVLGFSVARALLVLARNRRRVHA